MEKGRKRSPKEKEEEEPPTQVAKVMFSCQQCGHQVPPTRRAFQKDTLDHKTWCAKCAKSWMTKMYNCPCGKVWYTCSIHITSTTGNAGGDNDQQTLRETAGGDQSQLYNTVARVDKSARKSNHKRPKQALEGGHDEGYSRKKHKVIAPGFRPSMLSDGLKRKFAHLCHNDN